MKSYTVYHLEEMKKVGCTSRWPQRMIEQGFEPREDMIKFKTNCIKEASMVEEELRKFHGYKKDSPFKYVEKFNTMGKFNKRPQREKVNLDTEYVGLNELHKGATKEDLRAFLDQDDTITLGTSSGTYVFNRSYYSELVDKAQESQYKDFYWSSKWLKTIYDGKITQKPCSHGNTIPEFQQIRDWATDKGIFTSGDPKTQYIKLQEEAGEVAKAILNNDEPEIIDGLGDVLVVLINLSHLCGYKLEDCLATAYDVIKKRKGKMENGTFIKDI